MPFDFLIIRLLFAARPVPFEAYGSPPAAEQSQIANLLWFLLAANVLDLFAAVSCCTSQESRIFILKSLLYVLHISLRSDKPECWRSSIPLQSHTFLLFRIVSNASSLNRSSKKGP